MGIKIGDQQFKISKYADDTILTIPYCEESLSNTLGIFYLFG